LYYFTATLTADHLFNWNGRPVWSETQFSCAAGVSIGKRQQFDLPDIRDTSFMLLSTNVRSAAVDRSLSKDPKVQRFTICTCAKKERCGLNVIAWLIAFAEYATGLDIRLLTIRRW
jgi:hypothetical protein